MKTLSFFILLVCVSSLCCAQKTKVEDFVKERITDLLLDDGVIFSTAEINKFQAQKDSINNDCLGDILGLEETIQEKQKEINRLISRKPWGHAKKITKYSSEINDIKNRIKQILDRAGNEQRYIDMNNLRKKIEHNHQLTHRLLKSFGAENNYPYKNEFIDCKIKNKSFALFGSLGFSDTNGYKGVDSSIKNSPDFPVLMYSPQIVLKDATIELRSWCKIEYTSESLFKTDNNTEINTEFKNYFAARLQFAFQKDYNKKRQLSIGIGYFENELAKIFERARAKDLSPGGQFSPLYHIWANNNTTLKYVVKNFSGICYFQKTGITDYSDIRFQTEANTSITIPFLKTKSENTLEWGKENKTEMTYSKHGIAIIENSIEHQEIPTIQEIKALWDLKHKEYCSFNAGESPLKIDYNKPLEFSVKFGPVGENDASSIILLNKEALTKEFIYSIEIIKREYNQSEGNATFTLRVMRDDNYINTTTPLSNGEFRTDNIELEIGYPIIQAGLQLSHKYRPFSIFTECKPSLALDGEKDLTGVLNTSNQKYEYKFKLKIESLPDQLKIKRFDLENCTVTCNQVNSENSKKMKFNSKDGIITTQTESSIDITLSIKEDEISKFFGDKSTLNELQIEFPFYDQNQVKYQKKITVNLINPIPSSLHIVVTDSTFSNINESFTLNDGTTISEVIGKSTENGQILKEVLKDHLIKAKVLTYSPADNRYYILREALKQ